MELNKQDLIAAVSDTAGVSKAAAQDVLDSFVDVVNAAVAQGNVVGLPGIGKFEAVPTAPRTGRNPHTGEPIAVAASHRVKFRAAKRLKDSAKGS